jgi:hypothetical protein
MDSYKISYRTGCFLADANSDPGGYGKREGVKDYVEGGHGSLQDGDGDGIRISSVVLTRSARLA